MSITIGNWMVGKTGDTVVSDQIPESYKDNHNDGRTATDYYGGFLIGESIRPDDAKFLAASKNLLLQAAQVVKEINRDDLESVRELKKMISQFI